MITNPRLAVHLVDQLQRLGEGIEDQRPVVLVVLDPVRLPLHDLGLGGGEFTVFGDGGRATAWVRAAGVGTRGREDQILRSSISAAGAGGGIVFDRRGLLGDLDVLRRRFQLLRLGSRRHSRGLLDASGVFDGGPAGGTALDGLLGRVNGGGSARTRLPRLCRRRRGAALSGRHSFAACSSGSGRRRATRGGRRGGGLQCRRIARGRRAPPWSESSPPRSGSSRPGRGRRRRGRGRRSCRRLRGDLRRGGRHRCGRARRHRCGRRCHNLGLLCHHGRWGCSVTTGA